MEPVNLAKRSTAMDLALHARGTLLRTKHVLSCGREALLGPETCEAHCGPSPGEDLTSLLHDVSSLAYDVCCQTEEIAAAIGAPGVEMNPSAPDANSHVPQSKQAKPANRKPRPPRKPLPAAR